MRAITVAICNGTSLLLSQGSRLSFHAKQQKDFGNLLIVGNWPEQIRLRSVISGTCYFGYAESIREVPPQPYPHHCRNLQTVT